VFQFFAEQLPTQRSNLRDRGRFEEKEARGTTANPIFKQLHELGTSWWWWHTAAADDDGP